MVRPSFCTSFGPMWRNTSAALSSPRDISRIAAFSTWEMPLALSLLEFGSLIRYPGLHYLRHAARIFRHQGFHCIHMLIVGCVLAWQQRVGCAGEGYIRTASDLHSIHAKRATHLGLQRRQGFILPGFRQPFQYRPEYTKDQEDNQQETRAALDQIPEPGLFPHGGRVNI